MCSVTPSGSVTTRRNLPSFGYEDPMAYASVLGLNLSAQWMVQCLDAPRHLDIRAFGQHILTKVIGHRRERGHGDTLPCWTEGYPQFGSLIQTRRLRHIPEIVGSQSPGFASNAQPGLRIVSPIASYAAATGCRTTTAPSRSWSLATTGTASRPAIAARHGASPSCSRARPMRAAARGSRSGPIHRSRSSRGAGRAATACGSGSHGRGIGARDRMAARRSRGLEPHDSWNYAACVISLHRV